MTKQPHDASSSSTTTQSPPPRPTHYEILRVSPNASYEVIKTSHRYLAKQCHPDKNHASSSTTDDNLTKANSQPFHRLQEAWECLRDATKRKEYDEEFQRSNYRCASRRQSAIQISLSQFEQVVVAVDGRDHSSPNNEKDENHEYNDHENQPQGYELREQKNGIEQTNYDDDNNNNDHRHHVRQRDILFIYSCRCGHEIELWADQVPIDDKAEVLLDCNGCSNVFCVVNDISYYHKNE